MEIDDVTLRFTWNDDGETVTKCYNAAVFAEAIGADYRFTFDKLRATQMRTAISCELLVHGEIAQINRYSVEAYVTAMRRANAPQTLKNLLGSLLAYGDAADSYFTR